MMFWAITFLSIFAATTSLDPLSLTSDGPVYYKANITFDATLTTSRDDPFKYEFTTNVPGYKNLATNYGGRQMRVSNIFDIPNNKTGNFWVTCKVYKQRYFVDQKIAQATLNFVLSDSVVAEIVFRQNGTVLNQTEGDSIIASSNMTTNCTVKLYDPPNYFYNTSFSYYWKVDNTQGATMDNFLYNFTDLNQRTSILMRMSQIPAPKEDPAGTSIVRYVIAKEPVGNLNVTGDLWLRRGQLATLTFTCNGSVPIFYCHNFSMNDTIAQTCDPYLRSDKCSFQVTQYFKVVGDYKIRVWVKNVLNEALNVPPLMKEYGVHLYDVPPSNQLAFVILPVCCILFGVLILFGGMILFKKHRDQILQQIEVADFNFTELHTDPAADANLPPRERTLLRHIYDDVKKCMKRRKKDSVCVESRSRSSSYGAL